MKLNKYFLGLLCIPALIMSACSSDDDYSMATISGEQVYFSKALGNTFEISPSASSVSLPVNRVSTAGSSTYSLAVTQPADSKYTISNSVSFQDGQDVGYITISYDPEKIVFGEYEDITIKIADEASTTPYGSSSYSFKLGVTAWTEWKDWNAAGTATYYYSLYMSGDDPELPFSYRQNTIEQNLYQFKLEHWFYDVDLIINYDSSTGNITIDPQGTGYVNSNYGEEVMVTDYNNYWMNIREREVTPAYGEFDMEQGIFALPVSYYISLGAFGNGYEYLYIDGVDRKDVSTEVAYAGKFIDAKEKVSVVAQVTLGKDVSNANVALVAGDLTEDVYNAIIDGTYSPIQEVTESGQVYFSADELEDGDYTFVVVPFREGEVQENGASTATFKYTSGQNEESWTPLYTGVYAYTVEDYTSDKSGGIYEGSTEATLYVSESDETRYKIAPWAGEDSKGLIFTLNDDGTIVVDGVDTGDAYSTYGEIFATDFVTAGLSSSLISNYDPETGVFSFYLAYQVEAGSLAYALDTFTLTGKASVRATTGIKTSMNSKKVIKKQKSIKKNLMLK